MIIRHEFFINLCTNITNVLSPTIIIRTETRVTEWDGWAHKLGLPTWACSTVQSILDKINTHSLQGYSGCIKSHYLQIYQENCTMMDCYVCKNWIYDLTNFISPMTGIFSLCTSHKNNIIFNHLHDMFILTWVSLFYSTLRERDKCFNYYK